MASDLQDRSPPRAALAALCLTQVVSWGVLYYAFPVLLPRITAETGWSANTATAAFSAALLTSALAGIPVGRILDRRGPRAVMTTGSTLGVLAVVGIAAAGSRVAFLAAWILAGLAMAMTFYLPAFAALTRWYGSRAVWALTVLTLAGGLASTVFAPLTAVLAEHLSWRATYGVLAVILAVLTIPLHLFALRGCWPAAAIEPDRAAGPDRTTHSRPFLLLAASLTLSGFAVHAVVITLVPLMLARGIDAGTAAWVLGLGGLGQTLGRTVYAAFARRTGVTTRTTVLIGLGAVTTAALAIVPGPAVLLILLSIAAGMVRGNLTLLNATAVPDRWGAAHYGHRSALQPPETVTFLPGAAGLTATFGGGQAATRGSRPLTRSGSSPRSGGRRSRPAGRHPRRSTRSRPRRRRPARAASRTPRGPARVPGTRTPPPTGPRRHAASPAPLPPRPP